MFNQKKEQIVNLQKELLELKSQLFDLKFELKHMDYQIKNLNYYKEICKCFNIDNNYILIQKEQGYDFPHRRENQIKEAMKNNFVFSRSTCDFEYDIWIKNPFEIKKKRKRCL